ncbi:hypothetical protein GGX14DRAFT_581120 [Mycena pura]|uniref:Uncharacterized protein n=1 Tax=Mycena pura TaxID=153505 RepID=A0AAD6XX25_9AGAR|nr:hypothetical protein GGX14DRAFT_581120 [Mycena pura]
MAGDSDARLEAIRNVDTSEMPQVPSRESNDAEPSVNDGALTAVGELEEGHLPAFDQNTLQRNAAMRLRPYELEEYFLQYPKREYISSDDSSSDEEQQIVLRRRANEQAGWTQVGRNYLHRVDAEGAKASDALVIKRSFFPDWFSADDKYSSEDEDGEESEPDTPELYNITVPKLPAWKPIELNMFESIKQELSDDEEIYGLLTEEDSETDDDANIQVALLESWKSSRAQGLDAGRRASESKVHVGVTVVELDDNGNEIEGTRTYNANKRASKDKSKGKSVDIDEKGPRYDEFHQPGPSRPKFKPAMGTNKPTGAGDKNKSAPGSDVGVKPGVNTEGQDEPGDKKYKPTGNIPVTDMRSKLRSIKGKLKYLKEVISVKRQQGQEDHQTHLQYLHRLQLNLLKFELELKPIRFSEATETYA